MLPDVRLGQSLHDGNASSHLVCNYACNAFFILFIAFIVISIMTSRARCRPVR